MKTLLLIGWTTVNSEKAGKLLAREIVEQKLAACVQMDGPIQSIYEWEGVVQSEREWRLMIKFSSRHSEKLNAFIEDNHPYEKPEWVVLHADQVAPGYLKWVFG